MTIWTQALQDGYNLRLTITQSSQNIAANTSVISGRLEVHRPSGQADYTSYSTVWSTSINGVNASGTTGGYDFSSYSILTLRSWTQTIAHNADGTKSISVAGAWRETDPDPQVGYTTARDAGGTFTLTTIPRTSQATLSDYDWDAGDTVTINTNRASSSFTHDIKYSFGGLTNQTAGLGDATAVATSTTFTPPLSLLSQIPNSTSGTGTITVTTKSGSTVIGSDNVSFTIRAPSEITPTIGSVTHSEAVTLVNTEVGAYVKNLTKLNVGISGEAGAYGSTISTRKIVVNGQTINADSGTTPNVISASGTVPIVATVTDSRGRSKSLTQNVTVLDYADPTVTVSVQRSDVSGVPQPDGTTMRINITGSTKSLINGTEKNAIYYTIYTRLRGTTSWGTAKVAKTSLGYTTSGGRLNYSGFRLLSTYPITESHEVRVDISDDFKTVTGSATMATAAIDVHYDSNVGVGIGKFREQGRLDVNGDIYGTRVRVTSAEDVSLTSTNHGFQIGPTTSTNLRIDNNEIQAVNNGAASSLNLQLDGGSIAIGPTATIRFPSTGDVSPTSTGHPFQIGPDDGLNVGIDNNQLQGRNNFVAASYAINSEGGDVGIGNSASVVNIPGHMNSSYSLWSDAVGSVSVAASGVTTVTFPAGRFDVAPRVFAQITSGTGTVSVTWVTSITATDFQIRCYTLGGVQVAATCAWYAVQKNATASTG